MNHSDNLDRILDQALGEYREAEPLAGMEDRILRRISTQPEPTSRRWAWIFATGAALIVLVVALWLGLRDRSHQQTVARKVSQPVQQAATNATHGETPPLRLPRPTARIAEAGRAGARPQSPRQDMQATHRTPKPALKQFPAPAPLTTEEHALLALARTHPDALLAPPDEAGKVSITPIDIKPLAPEAEAPQGEPE